MQAMGGSVSAARFLVSKGHADVNALAANTGLTPLMCSALNRKYPNKVSKLETLLNKQTFHDANKKWPKLP